jgi:hypothetical protein
MKQVVHQGLQSAYIEDLHQPASSRIHRGLLVGIVRRHAARLPKNSRRRRCWRPATLVTAPAVTTTRALGTASLLEAGGAYSSKTRQQHEHFPRDYHYPNPQY